MNFEQARYNMVEQQVRPWEVLDQRVLDLMLSTPREAFVPEAYRTLAFADTQIPLDDGQVMMPPRVEARLVQSLELRPFDRVLEIGTGSGYLTALLAQLCERVVSVEISATLHAGAAEKLRAHHIANVHLERGNAAKGWPISAPYDAIAVTASVPVLEAHFQRQLKPGGRLFVIVGEAPVMEARLITRVDEYDFSTDSLFETVIPPLIGVEQPDRFVL